MDFYDFTTLFDIVKPTVVPWRQLYAQKLSEIIQSRYPGRYKQSGLLSAYFNQCEAERVWYLHKKPYYKLCPDILPWIFEAARLNVPNELLRLPFPSILVRLPKNHNLDFLSVDDKYFARSMLMTEHRDADLIHLDTGTVTKASSIIVWVDFGERDDPGGFPVYQYHHLKFKAGMSVEESLQIAQSKEDPNMVGLVVSKELMENCLRVCAAVCFLSTGADRIVEADVLNKDAQKYAQACRQAIIGNQADKEAGEKKQKEIKARAIRRGKHGWTIGRNRELIFPSQIQNSEGSGDGSKLSHQHQRCGHFHVVRYGSGKANSKVQWYRQLTVRPDLPAPPAGTRRGYKTH